MLIKNNIVTKGQTTNTASSHSLLRVNIPRDIAVTTKVRVGVVFLGKSNLSK
jgi:Asp-tRNA(Asn)/Glu-tRNA(Gln) amidotransferase A subunit family amidase